MAILDILKFPDPRLRKKSKPVEDVTPEIVQFVEDMKETMYSFKGIGLAAPQVDRLERVITIDVRRTDEDGARYPSEEMTELELACEMPMVIINPEIVAKEGKTTYEEGCLSVPTYYETVDRFEYVEVEAMGVDGKPFLIKVDGLVSICIQHEIDHLDGKLFLDRLSLIKGNRIRSQIRKHGYPDPKDDDEDEGADGDEEKLEKEKEKELERM